jgi:phospholipid/cholesterol/gamma-HCH transport system substrate-binding protein
MRRLSGFFGRIAITTLIVVALVAAGAGAAIWYFARSSPTYEVQARFASGQGLFEGASVSVLGVKVGSVTKVQFQGSTVLVTMAIDTSQPLPSLVDAQLVEPLLLGTPDIDLSPGYTAGPKLTAGTVIPETHTAVPVSTDQLLSELERVLGAIKPSSAHQLVTALASDIQGQGAALNHLLSNGAATVSLLASKGNDLGKLNGELASLTATLRSHESELASLITDYDTVAAVLTSHQQQLGEAITQLADASEQLAGILTPNLKPIEADVGVITTVGRTLDRNLSYLDTTVESTVSLFGAAQRAYDPTMHWLNLNDQLAPGETASVIEGLVRDRLAGVCRRILANHSTGLPTTALSTLASCGNPDSNFFNPILGTILGIVEGLPSANSLSSLGQASSALTKALSTIPGLTPSQRKAVSGALANPPPTTPSGKGSSSTSKGETSQQAMQQLDQQLNEELGPLPSGAGSTGSTGATGPTGATGTTGSGGLGGLLGAAK